jgi:hypothetical protein
MCVQPTGRLCLSFNLRVSVCLHLSVRLSVSVCDCLCLRLRLCPSVCVCLCLCPYVCVYARMCVCMWCVADVAIGTTLAGLPSRMAVAPATKFSPELRDNLPAELRSLLEWELPLAHEEGAKL